MPPKSHAVRKILLIQPKIPPSFWGQEHFLEMTPYDAVYPPLGLLTLAAATPSDCTVVLCDENAGETIDWNTDADIIGITGYLFQLTHVFAIADRFRARGKFVAIGGPAATLVPEDCRAHCDVLFVGEAEYTWPRFLADHAAGVPADRYEQEDKIHLPDSPMPRLDLLQRSYSQGIVQTSRGCPFTCEFCDIIVMYGRKMRYKTIPRVLAELEAWQAHGVGKVFFADDNFIGNRAYAKELLRAIAAWNAAQQKPLGFYTQASVDMVRDEELLGLLRDANFFAVFIGIESPRKANLAETRKTQNEKVDLVQAIHKIQSYNLFVWAGMIVGFDHDDASIFEEQYEFLQAAQIPFVFLNALDAAPRTPLHERMRAAGRLVHSFKDATAPTRQGNGMGDTNFEPLLMTRGELKQGLDSLFRRLYEPAAFSARLEGNLSRFRDVSFRPESLRHEYLSVFLRMTRHYFRQGWGSTWFYCRAFWIALRHAPRFTGLMGILMGMYAHFRVLHAASPPPPTRQPFQPPPLRDAEDCLPAERNGHAPGPHLNGSTRRRNRTPVERS